MQKPQLTEKQKEVLNLMRQGYKYKEIAHNLRLSIHTVHGHVKTLFNKYGVDNKIELINRVDTPYK